ncbi:hypothetical protein [Roseobacter sp. HKCCA0434]|uniref:hypothetical protein n=1 Tax=Roseobacter sp. HKCCA0434 TaxID=3079297 RepID=UPI0029057F40|nr:hypothetical protein [Roseobacter sp. HKCCA0434]
MGDEACHDRIIDITDKDIYEIELIKAQTALALKQAQTEFWKIGIATTVAGAAIGGVMVRALF